MLLDVYDAVSVLGRAHSTRYMTLIVFMGNHGGLLPNLEDSGRFNDALRVFAAATR